MKAILLIEVDDGHLWKEANTIYDRLKGYKCVLKPLPLKRKSEVGWYNESQSIKTHELTCYDKGWNDCIEFIEGGQDALEEEN